VTNRTELPDPRIDDFRRGLYECFGQRANSLFDVVEGILKAPEVCCVAHLSLTPDCSVGHGGLYGALNHGTLAEDDLTDLLVRAGGDYPEVYTIDCTTWPREQARTSPGRVMSYHAKTRDDTHPSVPGWNVSVVARQTPDHDSWVVPASAAFVGPHERVADVTLAQIETVTTCATSRPLFVLDSGYGPAYLTKSLRERGTPADVLVRVRSNRVFYGPVEELSRRGPGRPCSHGARLELRDPQVTPTQTVVVVVGATALEIDAWSHQHAKSNFTNAELTLGWVIRVKSRRAHQRDLWLFYSGDEDEVDLERLYHAYVHRFDIEHFFRFAKQRLGLVAVTLRHPGAALRWVRLVMSAYAQLVLARECARDLRLPWERALEVSRLTPRRVLRAFSQRWANHWSPPETAKLHRGGPGRALGSKNRRATRHTVTMKTRTRRF
jgi:hypothetical protein